MREVDVRIFAPPSPECEDVPPGPFGVRVGRRGTFWDWLAVIGCALVVAAVIYNARWQSYLDRKQAEIDRDWELNWAHRPPGDRVRKWVRPDIRFVTPFNRPSP